MDRTVLVAPGRTPHVRTLTCERLSLTPGETSETLRSDTEEHVGYVTTGYGRLLTAGGGGQWPYVFEQGMAFWLGRGIDWSITCDGEAPLVLTWFHYVQKPAPPMVGLARRIMRSHETRPEIELGRSVRILFRGPAIGSGTMVTVEESTYSGTGESPLHHADGMEEVFYFVRGRGRVRLGDEVVRVGPGDAMAIPSGLVHNVRADEGQTPVHVTCNVLI